jgi:hypothetical protein
MKGAIFGAVGVCGVGAAVVGGGGGAPDDFVAVVSKPPSAVYVAFADIGPPGDKTEIVPKKGGYAAKLTRRVIKVPNEQVKFEFLIDDEALLTAEVQMSAEGSGTRLAAEIDFNHVLLRQIVEESGAEFPVPSFVFQEFLIDQVFAQAMTETVERIERGQGVLSLADTHARWGREDGRSETFSHTSRPYGSGYSPRQSARPQMDASPTLDPDAARQRPNEPSFQDY